MEPEEVNALLNKKWRLENVYIYAFQVKDSEILPLSSYQFRNQAWVCIYVHV